MLVTPNGALVDTGELRRFGNRFTFRERPLDRVMYKTAAAERTTRNVVAHTTFRGSDPARCVEADRLHQPMIGSQVLRPWHVDLFPTALDLGDRGGGVTPGDHLYRRENARQKTLAHDSLTAPVIATRLVQHSPAPGARSAQALPVVMD